MMRYDSIIVGSGPAGLEAALNLKIRNKNFLLFGNPGLSTKLERAPKIDNYLGFPSISGKELQSRFLSHLSQMEIHLRHEMVNTVYPMGNYFSLATNKDTYEASTVILAPGVATASALPGEERLLGHGVGYCATCDAPLYRNKAVAILGYNDEAVHEANFVAELAAKVYYIPMRKHTAPLKEEVEAVSDRVLEILGEQSVCGLVLEHQTLEVDGVFILRESIAPTALVPGIQVENGFVKVDADMRTNLPGLFAAGDCTGKPHQYMRAAGQGQTAALHAVTYLDQK